MLAPLSAIRPAMAAMAAARSGAPITVTCDRPSRRPRLSPVPRSMSTLMPRSVAVAWTASRSRFQSRGAVTRMPRISRRRSTICSMSRTSTPALVRVAKIAEVTPGRSFPETVRSRVSGFWSVIAVRGYRRAGPGVGGGPYRVAHEPATPHLRLHRAGGARPRRRQAVLRRRARLELHRLRPRVHRHPAARRRGRDRRAQPRAPVRPGAAAGDPLQRRPRRHPRGGPVRRAARSTRSRSSSPAAGASTSPTRRATPWRSGRPPESGGRVRHQGVPPPEGGPTAFWNRVCHHPAVTSGGLWNRVFHHARAIGRP